MDKTREDKRNKFSFRKFRKNAKALSLFSIYKKKNGVKGNKNAEEDLV